MKLDILFSGCPRRNIVKQNDISILCIHEKKRKGFVSNLRKLERKGFLTYKKLLLYAFLSINNHFICPDI